MKLLLDQGLPRSAVRLLADAGFDAAHVADLGLAAAEDASIIDIARARGYVVVTLDADFHAILALTRATMPSTVRIRIEGLRAESLSQLLVHVVKTCGDDLAAGAMITVDADHIRIRHLPVMR